MIVRLTPWLLALTLAAAVDAAVYHTSQHSSYQEVIDKVQPGDAVVFDGTDGSKTVSVTKPLTDIQFIGGGAHWTVAADITDCAFLWHSTRLDQPAGRIRRTVFYQSMSSGGMFFSHADSVSLIYAGGLLGPQWNPDPVTSQLQLNGFVRGVLIYKPITSYMGASRRDGQYAWDWRRAPSLRINATDPVGNGRGTHIISPIIWEQTNWVPFHIVRGTGITFSHCNTEYERWASPIVELDYGENCTFLCNGPGGRSNATNDAYKDICLLNYPDGAEWGSNNDGTPRRGGIFHIAGQNNKVAGTGSYRQWTIGSKDWLPCRHLVSGWVVRDPFFAEYPGDQGYMGVNFAEAKDVFRLRNDGFIEQFGARRYPLDGADVIEPVVMRVPDLRACPSDYKDMTGQSPARIRAAVEGGDKVYLGAGTYAMGASLSGKGVIFGAGIGKTILQFDASAEGNTNSGFINCTVKGGKYGMSSDGGVFGKTLLRTRFEDMTEAGIVNRGCWQNDIFLELEFHNCKRGISEEGATCGEPFKSDKNDVLSCSFSNIDEHAIHMTTGTPRNGHNAVVNCSFDSIGGNAILIDGGGTHLVQSIDVRNCYMQGGRNGAVVAASHSWSQAVSMSHVNVDNSAISATGTAIICGGYGVLSHATVKGFGGRTAVNTKTTSAVDHVVADGTLEGGAYVARSRFSDFSVGIADSKVALRTSNANTLKDGHTQELDRTPPPAVTTASATRKANDPEYPYLADYNLVTWDHVVDEESGIVAYIVYANGTEVGRTPSVRCNVRAIDYSSQTTVTDNFFRDPQVQNANYEIKPVNGANMLPDGSQAPLRRWSPMRGRWRTDNGQEFRIHQVNATAHTVTDTVRGLTVNWDEKSSSPRFVNSCIDAPSHNEKIVSAWGEYSTRFIQAVSVGDVKASRRPLGEYRLGARSFHVPNTGRVRVALYDAKGRRVRVLFDGVVEEGGCHSLTSYHEGLARGWYVMRLVARHTSLSRPITTGR